MAGHATDSLAEHLQSGYRGDKAMQLRTKALIIVTAVIALLLLIMYAAAQIIVVNGSGDLQTRAMYFVAFSAAVGLTIAYAAVFLIEKIGIGLMDSMTDAMRNIRTDRDLSARVPVAGHDEVSQFATAVNETLDALQTSRRQLEESEGKYRSLVESINDVVWETDADLQFTYVSPKVPDLTGYEPGELTGKTPFDMMGPGERDRLGPVITDMINRKGSFALVEFSMLRKDGSRAELEISGTAIRDFSGRIVGYRGITRDIGERKRSEEALRESEERLRLCVATASLGTFDWDIANDRHLWSPETHEIYGVPPDTPLTFDYLKGIIYPGDQQDAAVAAGMDPAGPGAYSIEYRIIRASDRAVRWVYARALVFFSGDGAERHAVRVLGVIQDITERKQVEEAMRKITDELEFRVQQRTAELEEANRALTENESKYRDLVQNANSMIIRFDMSGRITYFNEFACTFFGYSHDEIIGSSVLETIVPQAESSGRNLWKHMEDLMESPDQYMINVNQNVRRNGERVWVSWTNKAVIGRDGRIEDILAIGNDVTDLKHASDALKRVNDTLEFRVQQRTAELASAVEALQAEIAERMKVEAQMKSSLQEKEVLLKEIHHRVKNNLQIISSLLSLQSGNIKSEDPASMFRDSQDRIRSMALIHEKLYQARDISRVDFAEYVRSLTAYLSRSYMAGHGVEVVIGIENIYLDIDKAIPCGLIINELRLQLTQVRVPGRSQGSDLHRPVGQR